MQLPVWKRHFRSFFAAPTGWASDWSATGWHGHRGQRRPRVAGNRSMAEFGRWTSTSRCFLGRTRATKFWHPQIIDRDKANGSKVLPWALAKSMYVSVDQTFWTCWPCWPHCIFTLTVKRWSQKVNPQEFAKVTRLRRWPPLLQATHWNGWKRCLHITWHISKASLRVPWSIPHRSWGSWENFRSVLEAEECGQWETVWELENRESYYGTGSGSLGPHWKWARDIVNKGWIWYLLNFRNTKSHVIEDSSKKPPPPDLGKPLDPSPQAFAATWAILTGGLQGILATGHSDGTVRLWLRSSGSVLLLQVLSLQPCSWLPWRLNLKPGEEVPPADNWRSYDGVDARLEFWRCSNKVYLSYNWTDVSDKVNLQFICHNLIVWYIFVSHRVQCWDLQDACPAFSTGETAPEQCGISQIAVEVAAGAIAAGCVSGEVVLFLWQSSASEFTASEAAEWRVQSLLSESEASSQLPQLPKGFVCAVRMRQHQAENMKSKRHVFSKASHIFAHLVSKKIDALCPVNLFSFQIHVRLQFPCWKWCSWLRQSCCSFPAIPLNCASLMASLVKLGIVDTLQNLHLFFQIFDI